MAVKAYVLDHESYTKSVPIPVASKVTMSLFLVCHHCGQESIPFSVGTAVEARLKATQGWWLTVDGQEGVLDFCFRCTHRVARGPRWERFVSCLEGSQGGVRALNLLEKANLGAVSVVEEMLDEGLNFISGLGAGSVARIRDAIAASRE